MNLADLKMMLAERNPTFWNAWARHLWLCDEFYEVQQLVSLRKKAVALGLVSPWQGIPAIKLALVGGYTNYPLSELIPPFCESQGLSCAVWSGDFDNYISEIMDEGSSLYEYGPDVVVIIPSERRCRHTGAPTDNRVEIERSVASVVETTLGLCNKVHEHCRAEVILCNFMLPPRYDPGAYRCRTLASDWSFRKQVNLELGLTAPSHVQICDLEFLSYRLGGLKTSDSRSWFETKQLSSFELLPSFARELALLTTGLRRTPKKVLVLDLDNTLWGGVVADDGLDGIELGDTSPRGEAFKAFQHHILGLKERGVLLAVCSKNDFEKAREAFEKHPEMVLSMEDITSFQANWEPKSENIRRIASELNLGLDSLVFVDDNPAEIEIVRQFVPEVTTILLGPDPSEYVLQLQDSRLFEPRMITVEDSERTALYRTETKRSELLAEVTDMNSYLESLGMEAEIHEFNPLDFPRVAQLINKSNQFNLTTRRRSEGELQTLMQDPSFVGFSIRLRDRFGDHGLIAVVIGERRGKVFHVDTWLMSCRVLKRQVEEITLNEMARLAVLHGCHVIKGFYLPTAKNLMVADLYPKMGFNTLSEIEKEKIFQLEINSYQPQKTHITITKKSY